jgi:hypothetical protein
VHRSVECGCRLLRPPTACKCCRCCFHGWRCGCNACLWLRHRGCIAAAAAAGGGRRLRFAPLLLLLFVGVCQDVLQAEAQHGRHHNPAVFLLRLRLLELVLGLLLLLLLLRQAQARELQLRRAWRQRLELALHDTLEQAAVHCSAVQLLPYAAVQLRLAAIMMHL